MAPNILPGDWLLGDPDAPFRWGDVVIIDRGERWVAHRVIRTGRQAGWEMGDGTPSGAGFANHQVIARVVTVVGPHGHRDLTSWPERARGRLWASRSLVLFVAGRAARRFRQRGWAPN